MPKLLDTPETLIEQKALAINRKDIVSYTVDTPTAGGAVVRCTVLGRQVDGNGNPIDGRQYDAPALVDDAVTALSIDAGTRTVLRTLQLLNLSDTATLAALKTALTAHPEAPGEAYYEGTRDALYATV